VLNGISLSARGLLIVRGWIWLPALLMVQVSGLLVFAPLYVAGRAGVLAAVGLWLLLRVAPRFSREKIIATL
jgi:hypothetical protein